MRLIKTILNWLCPRRVSNFHLLVAIHKSTSAILMKASELEAKLVVINTTLDKSKAEIVSAVDALKQQIENSSDPELSAGATAQLERLSAVATALDELNADAAPEPAPTPEEQPPQG